MHAISGELGDLGRFRPFLQPLGRDEGDIDRLWPDLHTLSAVNFLFWLSVESGPADKAMAWYTAGRVCADSCRAMHEGLARHQFGDISDALYPPSGAPSAAGKTGGADRVHTPCAR